MRTANEIAVLKDLLRATEGSADIAAAMASQVTDPFLSVRLEQLREDRRLLLLDLVRCLLLRGLPEAEVRTAMTEVLRPVDPTANLESLRLDLALADRKLELALRRVLLEAKVSQSTLELLSLHYLRLQLHGELLEPTAETVPAMPLALAGASTLIH
jgi:hypothetical protein